MPVRDGEESKAVANDFGMPFYGFYKKLSHSIYSGKIKNSIVLQDLTVCIAGEIKNWCCFFLKKRKLLMI